MPWRRFLLFNAIGALLWVGWWTTVAYLLGTHLVEIIEYVHPYRWWVIGIGIAAIATYATLHIRHLQRRRARRATPEPLEDASTGR
jgi:membrane protein DedA with SNARE-associated domain